MPNMPDKPETWLIVLASLSQHSPTLYAAGLSALMAGIRIIYGGGTRRQDTARGGDLHTDHHWADPGPRILRATSEPCDSRRCVHWLPGSKEAGRHCRSDCRD
ncbi:Phage holin family (Lysis protein S) [compost metagenome]